MTGDSSSEGSEGEETADFLASNQYFGRKRGRGAGRLQLRDFGIDFSNPEGLRGVLASLPVKHQGQKEQLLQKYRGEFFKWRYQLR